MCHRSSVQFSIVSVRSSELYDPDKKIKPGDCLRVRNSDDILSEEFNFTGSWDYRGVLWEGRPPRKA